MTETAKRIGEISLEAQLAEAIDQMEADGNETRADVYGLLSRHIYGDDKEKTLDRAFVAYRAVESQLAEAKVLKAEFAARVARLTARRENFKDFLAWRMSELSPNKPHRSPWGTVSKPRPSVAVRVLVRDDVPGEFRKDRTGWDVDTAAIKQHVEDTGEVPHGVEVRQTFAITITK